MEDTLINLETAKLLKKVKFDVECANYFYYEKENDDVLGKVYEDNEEFYYRPSQDLLKKWLRKTYNININIKHIPHNQKYGFSVTGGYNEKTGGIIVSYNFKGFDSYEECLEEGLQQCLNIIKDGKITKETKRD